MAPTTWRSLDWKRRHSSEDVQTGYDGWKRIFLAMLCYCMYYVRTYNTCLCVLRKLHVLIVQLYSIYFSVGSSIFSLSKPTCF